MCCGVPMLPNALGLKISQLKYGDQIIILKGEGFPLAQQETTDIIWKVDGYSALTAGGISISCMTISDLILTGNHFEDFLVSSEAKEIWQEIQELHGDDQVTSEPE